VVKRDRTHEPFDRRKLAGSIAKAFEKRSTSLLTLEDTVDEIVHELETSGREVPSSVIGAKVLEKLRAIDEVAYLRYASVYQQFPPEPGQNPVPGSHKIPISKNHGRV
jgi:transcriptional repressor NrdR